MMHIYATFTDPHMAEKAGGALLDHGVRPEHLTIVLPEGYGTRDRQDVVDEIDMERKASSGITTTTAADAASGSVKGAGVGLLAGTLAALAAILIPGVGLIIGGGTLAIALGGVAGATAAGAVAGGVTGFLKDQGVSEQSIKHFHSILEAGGAMITVSPTDDNTDSATIDSVLQKYGGVISLYPQGASDADLMGDEFPISTSALR
jgi:uncharacterized membrane protein